MSAEVQFNKFRMLLDVDWAGVNDGDLLVRNGAKVKGASLSSLKLTGLDVSAGGSITSADSVLSAFGKLEKRTSAGEVNIGAIQVSLNNLDARVALNDAKVTGADRLKLDGSNVMTGPLVSNGTQIKMVQAGVQPVQLNFGNSIFSWQGLSGIFAWLGDNGGSVFSLSSTRALGWSNTTTAGALSTNDVLLFRGGPNILELRNGLNAQNFNIYNTFTDAANYETLSIGWNSNVCTIQATRAGTGSLRNIRLRSAAGTLFLNDGNQDMTLNSTGITLGATSGRSISRVKDILFEGDNLYDLGTSLVKPRTGYFGTSIVTPRLNLSATLTPIGSADSQGSTGDVRYDDNFVYVKASTGWKRSALSTF